MKYLITAILLSSCTDATVSSFVAFGSAAEVTCYSGGKVTYQGRSTGRVSTVHQSDGWEFKDAATGKFVRVSGDCVIVN